MSDRPMFSKGLSRSAIKAKEEQERGEGAFEGPPFVVQTPLVAHVALEVTLTRHMHSTESFNDPIEWRSWDLFVSCSTVTARLVG